MIKFHPLLWMAFFYFHPLHTQNNILNEKKIRSLYCPVPPQIDGNLTDSIWKINPPENGNFLQQFPYDTSLAMFPSSVAVANDDKFLYIASRCSIPHKKKPVVQSLKRDFSFPVNDAFVVTLDPFQDAQNGFSFGLNPYGSQREGLIQSGGGMGVTTIWDNIWYSASRFNDSIWTMEIKIPFKSIRFLKNQNVWKINFSRNNLPANESSNWQWVPRQYNNSTLAFTGKLIFDKPPLRTGTNLAFIPYSIFRIYQNYEQNALSSENFNAGTDIKWTIGNSMSLDVTFNPDFSQVEADRQIINLTRFNLFFPEQRQFFLENSDLFERFGFRQIRPFFSRRIGLENGEFIPILYGLRLSGKPSLRWRTGLMNIQTLKAQGANLSFIHPENFSVGAFQYNLFARSNLAGILVHRQRTDTSGVFNTVLGVDYNLASKNNKWMGKIFFHHSFTGSQPASNAYAHASWLTYQDMNWEISWNHEYVDKNYDAQTGFTPRIFQRDASGLIQRFTYWRLEPNVYYNFYPKKNILNRFRTGIYADIYFNQHIQNTDQLLRTIFECYGQTTWYVTASHHYFYTRLLFPTDVSFTGYLSPIPAGNYYYHQGSIRLNSDQRKDIIPAYQFMAGTYFNGKKFSQIFELSLRQRPYMNFSIAYNREDIVLSENQKITLHLINPRLEITLRTNLFFTFFWQYNTQTQNINLNARMQWRFRPMSDFYIVWIDNYTSNTFSVRNRAVVGKIILWLNT